MHGRDRYETIVVRIKTHFQKTMSFQYLQTGNTSFNYLGIVVVVFFFHTGCAHAHSDSGAVRNPLAPVPNRCSVQLVSRRPAPVQRFLVLALLSNNGLHQQRH